LVHDGHPPSLDEDFDLEEDLGLDTNSGNHATGASPTADTTGGAPVTNHSSSMQPSANPSGPAPVIDNSRHLLDLSPPDKK
jgi:phospholipid-binding lipoprotein MlaA